MPLPLWFIGAAAGGLAHLTANEKNEKAKQLIREAEDDYNKSKNELRSANTDMEYCIKYFLNRKKSILNTSMRRFLKSYKKIKDVQFNYPDEIDNLSSFCISDDEVIRLEKLSDIYKTTLQATAAGSITGTAVALSLGAEFSLGTLAAPVILFTGISANMEADDNLIKAKQSYAEAELAIEKMRTNIIKCNAIEERTKILDDLLNNLNDKFAYCSSIMEAVLEFRVKFTPDSFSREEISLFAITRSLAGAIKAIIDTPIISTGGNLTDESQQQANYITTSIPAFEAKYEEIKLHKFNIDYDTLKIDKISSSSGEISEKHGDGIRKVAVIIISLIIAFACDDFEFSENVFIFFAALNLLTPKRLRSSQMHKRILDVGIFASSIIATNINTADYLDQKLCILKFIGIMIVAIAILIILSLSKIESSIKKLNDKLDLNIKDGCDTIITCIIINCVILSILAIINAIIGLPILVYIIIDFLALEVLEQTFHIFHFDLFD